MTTVLIVSVFLCLARRVLAGGRAGVGFARY